MANIIEPRTLPGFRDFLPEVLFVRKKVISTFTAIFEKYGFQPLETPTLEYQDILLGKYGEEAEKLMYLFTDNGERQVGLKYDLTVPTARVVAQYPNIVKPFKRYQIQPVFRTERPQKGRYREFTQCDIDTFGTTSPLADAEIVTIIQECLSAIGFREFKIKINSRRVLFQILESAGAPEDKYFTIIQSIDKLDKKTPEEVRVELAEKQIPNTIVENVFKQIEKAKPDENLDLIFNYLKKFDVPENFISFEPTLARGLDYYTGAIFETVVTEPKIGSVTGGGRYDKLIGSFTGNDTAAVGTSFGLDRIVDVITELNLWPDMSRATTKALITVFSPELLDKSIEINSICFKNNIPVEIYLDPNTKLDKQLKYADLKGIPLAIIIGPDEAEKNLVTVKNLRTKTQNTFLQSDLVEELSSRA